MTTYRDSGVDIDAGDEFVDRIKPLVRSTFRPEVLTDLGGFGGLFAVPGQEISRPGARFRHRRRRHQTQDRRVMMDKHDTVGIDLVAMWVNDIAVSGAEPLFEPTALEQRVQTFEQLQGHADGGAEHDRDSDARPYVAQGVATLLLAEEGCDDPDDQGGFDALAESDDESRQHGPG